MIKEPAETPASSELYRNFPLLKLPANLFLAPMAGWTDAAFRGICREWGAALGFTEMVSAESIVRRNPKSRALLARGDEEESLAVQIFTSNPLSAAACMETVRELSPCLVDLNCGCSVPKVLKTGSGAALMQNPALIGDIVHAMRQEIDVPIAVKIRSGWDRHSISFRRAADIAVNAGASMVTLHPRTRADLFSGTAQWKHIEQLKNLLDVPVIGSGDLFCPADVRRMLRDTGCDAVMIARGAMGNPFIFRQSAYLLTGREPLQPVSPEIRLRTALRQLTLGIEYKGETTACREARKQFCAYTKGLPGASRARLHLCRASTLREYREIVESYLNRRIP